MNPCQCPKNPPHNGLSGYYLYRKTGEDGEYARIKLLGANATSYTDNGLNQEGDYYYRLYAYYGEWDCTSAPANRHYYSNEFELHVYYSPTGVGDNESSLKVYPNPTQGFVTVEAEGMSQVSVYNALGQCVMQQSVEGQQVVLDLKEAVAGLYLLRVTTKEGEVSRRIVVER